MTPEMLELIWILAGCLMLSAGVGAWIAIVHWNERIKKVVERIESIVEFVEDQETLNRL